MEHMSASTNDTVNDVRRQHGQKKRNDNIDLIKVLACIAVDKV